jgi:cell division septation protein DedD
MSAAQQDTEITLGTGRMLALFFTFVLVCAVFFAIGFSLGRKTSAIGIGGAPGAAAGTASAAVRPSPAKGNTAPQSNDFSFYKTVGAQSANTELAPQDQQAQAPPTAAASVPAAPADVPPAAGGYFVQVAAVSRQEDAESLVDALKKKQYPAFSANSSSDKFFHVQVGPYAELKEAEALKARLIADGYSPIVKK